MITLILCCKDCTKRQLGCHSTCSDYIREKEEHDKTKSEIDRKRRADREMFYYGLEQKSKTLKLQRRRKKNVW